METRADLTQALSCVLKKTDGAGEQVKQKHRGSQLNQSSRLRGTSISLISPPSVVFSFGLLEAQCSQDLQMNKSRPGST